VETSLSEAQALIRDSLRDLLDREADLRRVRELEAANEWDARLWARLAELGWLGLPFPEALGGGDGSLVDLAIVVEELAAHATLVPYAEAIAAALTLHHHGQPDATAAAIGNLGAGGAPLIAAVLDERDSFVSLAGPDAVPGRISGRRIAVDYGQFAGRYLVRVERQGEQRLELVTAADARATSIITTGRTPAALVDFNDAPSAPATGPDGWAYLLELSRLLASVQALGCMQRAFDMTADYVKNRVQFGRPIGSFQAVQHHVANMAILLEATRFLAYEAAWALGEGRAEPEQLATVKAWTSKAAVEVTALAHQLHGGIGVTEEYDLHFFSLRAKERAVAWGTPAECLAVVAESIERPTDWTFGAFAS
jgi:alkylation response protein AidB-like acyl-CoA dehydrogenase